MRLSDRFGSMWPLRSRRKRGKEFRPAALHAERRAMQLYPWLASPVYSRHRGRWRYVARLELREIPF
jgi:hypothetical protein